MLQVFRVFLTTKKKHSHEPKEIGEINWQWDFDSQTVKKKLPSVHKQFEIQNPKKETTRNQKKKERILVHKSCV